MNFKVFFGVLLVALAMTQVQAGLAEKKLAKFFLLGVALAPRGVVPVPIPQFKHYGGHHHQKVEHVHVHAQHKHHDLHHGHVVQHEGYGHHGGW